MTDRFLYIHVHGDFSDPKYAGTPRQCQTVQVNYTGLNDSYSELTYAMLETLKADPCLLGKVENLERVVYYSNTSAPQVQPASMLLWLTGRRPHPDNKDPQWMR